MLEPELGAVESLAYLVVDDSDGAPVVGYTTLVTSGAVQGRLVQNKFGEILVAWSDKQDKSLGYLMLDSAFNLSQSAQAVYNLSDRAMDSPSLTIDTAGNFILTAMNRTEQDDLYYAALDPTGALLTPQALSFKTDPTGNYYVISGLTGQQVAPYTGGYPLYLSLIRR